MSVIAPPDTQTPAGRDAAAATTRPPGAPEVRAESAPARARGVELLGELPGSGYRQAPGLVRRGDGQTVQLTRLLYLVLAAIDGHRTYEEIAAVVTAEVNRLVSADNIRVLTESKLRPLGLLRAGDGSEPAVRRANPLLGLRCRLVVSNPRITRRITAPFAQLFRPLVVAVVLTAFLATAWWVLFDKGLASGTYQAFDQPGLLLLVFAVTVFSAGFHEFGHAAACRYGGATPGAMGVALYLVWPAFYTDVNDSYRLGRGGRLRVDLGGLYFNAIVAVAMAGLSAVTGWDALLLIVAAQVLQMVRQLAPFVRFDGYHILADLTGVPDLYSRIGPTLRGLLPARWGRPESRVLKPWARVVVTAWVLVVVPLLLCSLALMVLALPRVAATAWESLGRQRLALTTEWAAGDPAAVTVRLLSILAIGLPVLGMVYLLVRVVRRTVRNIWRATRGRPKRRAAAVLAGAAVVAGVAWAWWPDGDAYRPIERHERGAVPDVLPASHRQPVALPEAPLRAGERRTVRTVWPGSSPRPTREHPELAVVLVPRSPVTPEPTWVFPFNRPDPPEEGDNQALAVNTQDGSTVYDVAFALVWATDGTVDNVNEAYALASCTDCRTVAVAFQVVLAVGQADVVIPQNLSAAVNYECADCVTYALASQLVVTLPDGLSDETEAKLTALWRRIEAYGESIEGRSPQEIQAALEGFKEQILAILAEDAGATPSPSGSPTAVPDEGTSPGATAGPSAPPSGSAPPSAPVSPSGTASPSAAPSASPATSGSASPSGSPSASASPDELLPSAGQS